MGSTFAPDRLKGLRSPVDLDSVKGHAPRLALDEARWGL